MVNEIELKLLTHESIDKILPNILTQFKTEKKTTLQLVNEYYDSADHYLYHHKMGLRVRQNCGSYEMTIKDGGKVNAGLHQRSEYNIPLETAQPDITLLPLDIWPDGQLPESLIQGIKPIFSTNFHRQRWLVVYADSQIELVYDRGSIISGDEHQPINEIELELIKGSADSLLAFAQQLASQSKLRLFSQSKAARGYRMIGLAEPLHISPLPILTTSENATIEQGFITALELALSHWQYHEELWVDHQAGAKQQISIALTLIRQIWLAWGSIIPRKASDSLRLHLEQVQLLIQQYDQAENVVWREGYLQAKLKFLHYLQLQQWKMFCDPKAQSKLAMPFKNFADTMLERTGHELKKVFREIDNEQALRAQYLFLQRQLLNLYLFSGYYPTAQQQTYLLCWRTILNNLQQNNLEDWSNKIRIALSTSIFWRAR